MSGPQESNGRADSPREGAGVLANLPRTRPQRSTPRRTAARRASGVRESTAAAVVTAPPSSKAKPKAAPSRSRGAKANAKPSTARAAGVKAKAAGTRPKPSKARPRATAKPQDAPVPRQGFESEGDRVTGAIQPPGGAELLGSATEIFGELAKAGLSAGERLLKDVFSRLPGA